MSKNVYRPVIIIVFDYVVVIELELIRILDILGHFLTNSEGILGFILDILNILIVVNWTKLTFPCVQKILMEKSQGLLTEYTGYRPELALTLGTITDAIKIFPSESKNNAKDFNSAKLY